MALERGVRKGGGLTGANNLRSSPPKSARAPTSSGSKSPPSPSITATAEPTAEPEDTPAPAREGFDETDPATWGNPSRNDMCPCGSGKKFKHCHGALV